VIKFRKVKKRSLGGFILQPAFPITI